jgi:hypothetical protein
MKPPGATQSDSMRNTFYRRTSSRKTGMKAELGAKTILNSVKGVISDTHGSLRPEAVAVLRESDFIIHAGDIDEAANSGNLGRTRAGYGSSRQRQFADLGEKTSCSVCAQGRRHFDICNS